MPYVDGLSESIQDSRGTIVVRNRKENDQTRKSVDPSKGNKSPSAREAMMK